MAGGARRHAWFDWSLALLAAAYFVAIVVWDFGTSTHASAEGVGEGRVWLLATSALDVEGGLPLLQMAVAAAVAVFFIAREGARLWWVVTICAHVVSALGAYGVVGVAIWLGSDSAERVADDPDYGVSCVLAGSVGALFASGVMGMRSVTAEARTWSDRFATVVGALGLPALLTVTFGWYGMEHSIAFVIGGFVVWASRRRNAPPQAQHWASPSV